MVVSYVVLLPHGTYKQENFLQCECVMLIVDRVSRRKLGYLHHLYHSLSTLCTVCPRISLGRCFYHCDDPGSHLFRCPLDNTWTYLVDGGARGDLTGRVLWSLGVPWLTPHPSRCIVTARLDVWELLNLQQSIIFLPVWNAEQCLSATDKTTGHIQQAL